MNCQTTYDRPGSLICGWEVGQFALINCPSCPNSCVLVTLIVVCPRCILNTVIFEYRSDSLNVGRMCTFTTTLWPPSTLYARIGHAKLRYLPLLCPEHCEHYARSDVV